MVVFDMIVPTTVWISQGVYFESSNIVDGKLNVKVSVPAASFLYYNEEQLSGEALIRRFKDVFIAISGTMQINIEASIREELWTVEKQSFYTQEFLKQYLGEVE